MPNHVTNKLIVNNIKTEALQEMYVSIICNKDKCIDFNKLIPMPAHIYNYDISIEDVGDFGNHNCWREWSVNNWGTKWNAYETEIEYGEKLVIKFQTAWTVPYPFIIALSNKAEFNDFELRYIDEGFCFWGIEKWENGRRLKRMRDEKQHKNMLSIELMNYDLSKGENDD